MIADLERASGQRGKDVDLIGEIAGKMTLITKQLGLDPRDSTGKELYMALMSRMASDNARIANIIGAVDPDDVQRVVTNAVRVVEGMPIAKDCWVLKRSVAKKLLTAMPPRQLMKTLGYRSVTSMIKNEDIDELYTAIRFSEGPEWLLEYNKLFSTVKASDFESRKIRFVIMNHDKYAQLARNFVKKKLHNVTHTKEMGTIVVVPMEQERMKGVALKTLPLLLHYVNEIRLYSAFFKVKQVSKRFGEIVVETLNADTPIASAIGSSKIHWRVIQRYYGKLDGESHPEAFQPHVHPEDLHWRRAEHELTILDPEMSFWSDLDYVAALKDGAPLTLNFMDVSLSYANSESYEKRYYYHFRESLWNELLGRYMGSSLLEEQVLRRLDNDSFTV